MKQGFSARRLLVTCLLSVSAIHAHASGFRIPEASIAGLGTANALVANASEPGALAYNPAAMAFHEGITVVGGIIAIDPNLSVTTASGSHDSNVDSPFYAPSLYATGHVTPSVTWGLNINSPFGLETNWPSGAFPGFAGPFTGANPTRSKIEMVNINPNIAFKLGSDTSIAVGLDYYYVNDVRLDAGLLKISGDGSGYGFNLAALHTLGAWSFGGSYRSDVTADIDGVANTTSAATEVNFPWLLQVGARYQATKQLAIEFDIERTGWSKFDQIVIVRAVGTPITSANNWEDANAYRIGATFDLSPNTQLRIGYTYDQTGQGDDRFSARIPDADRHLVGLGIAQKFGAWTVEAGYMYVMFDDRNYVAPAALGTYGADANGTSAYNGSYEASVHLFGAGLSTKF